MAKKTPFEAFENSDVASALLGYSPPVRSEDAPLPLTTLFDTDGSLDPRALALDVDQVLAQDGVREMFESGYLPPAEALTRLLDLPQGTLGRSYGEYLQTCGRVPPRTPEPRGHRDPTTYVQLRLRLLHDLVHVVTGYDASLLGELAVQCFFLGQFESHASTTIVATAMVEILRTAPSQLGSLLALMTEAFTRGRDSRPVLSVPWEELWSAPLCDVTELARIAPRTSKIAALTFETPRQVTASRASTPSRVSPKPSTQGRSLHVPPKRAPDSPKPRQQATSSLVAAFAQLNREASQSHAQSDREDTSTILNNITHKPAQITDEPARADDHDETLDGPSPLGIPMDDDDLDDSESLEDHGGIREPVADPSVVATDDGVADSTPAENVLEAPQAPYPGEDDPDFF